MPPACTIFANVAIPVVASITYAVEKLGVMAAKFTSAWHDIWKVGLPKPPSKKLRIHRRVVESGAFIVVCPWPAVGVVSPGAGHAGRPYGIVLVDL